MEASPRSPGFPSLDDWIAVSPREAAAWFANLSAPWWIAGGWALDLFLGRETREHHDLDVGVLRENAGDVIHSLPGWEVFEAQDGILTPLSGAVPKPSVNCLWCKPKASKSWNLELMLDESDADCWVYRRDPTVRLELKALVKRTRDGIPYLAPEVQLLYKAKAVRPRDESDFRAVAPYLGHDARHWLLQSLARTLPSHPWIGKLERRGGQP